MRLKVFSKFLYQEFFIFSLLIFFIFGIFDFLINLFERLPKFLGFHKPFLWFVEYIFWKQLADFYIFFPFILPLSALLLVFWWSRNREIIGLLSLGFTKEEILKEFLKIYIVISIFFSLILTLIAPKVFFNTVWLWEAKFQNKSTKHLVFKNQIFFEGKDFFLFATPLEPGGEYLKDLIIIFFNNTTKTWDFNKIIWAEIGMFKNDKWILERATVQTKEHFFSPKEFSKLTIKLNFFPENLVVIEKSLMFLSFKELYQRLVFLKKVDKPIQTVIGEIFLRIFYIFLSICLVYIPLNFFIGKFNPAFYIEVFFKSFFLYLLVIIWFLFLQTFVKKGALWAGILLFFTMIFILFKTFSLVFLKKSGKNVENF